MLMNAAVSHELRNPLNSLVSGIETMQEYFNNLRDIYDYLKQTNQKVAEKIKLVLEGLVTNSFKMTSSAKFIDYFVHDMLDYTVLTNDKNNFVKDLQEFDVQDSIKQILKILEDKAIIKGIQTSIEMIGFESDYRIITDQKRLQQVLLNLCSNALKFTDKNGKIHVKAQL